MAHKLEIYSKTVGGFILHILNIFLVIAVVVVASKYFPTRPEDSSKMQNEPSIYKAYQEFTPCKNSLQLGYDRYSEISVVNICNLNIPLIF